MPWIKNKVTQENVEHIEGESNDEIEAKFLEWIGGQRNQGRTAQESEQFPGEWSINDQQGFIAIYFLDW